jgi:hypothetical protein
MNSPGSDTFKSRQLGPGRGQPLARFFFGFLDVDGAVKTVFGLQFFVMLKVGPMQLDQCLQVLAFFGHGLLQVVPFGESASHFSQAVLAQSNALHVLSIGEFVCLAIETSRAILAVVGS